jgi:hypothetical protein
MDEIKRVMQEQFEVVFSVNLVSAELKSLSQ